MNENKKVRTLTIYRGLQASGKSTDAKNAVRRDPFGTVRVNRDDLRKMIYDSYVLDSAQERALTVYQEDLVRSALASKKNVVVDDTNLRVKTVNGWWKIAAEFNGDVQVMVKDFEVDVDECVRRDAARIAAGERGVGEKVIRGASKRYMRNGSSLPDLPAHIYERIESGVTNEVYEEDESLPAAWIVDIDGTLAHMVGRSPYDYSRVDEDEPIQHVIDLVKTLKAAGNTILLMSGREDYCRDLTKEWLDIYGVPYDDLFMRATGDQRGDQIIKPELFEANVRGKFYIRGVLDDRDRVVKQWRKRGLFCAQVAPGNF